MDFLLERIIMLSCYSCYILNIRCGSFCMYKFGTRKTCTWIFGRLVFIKFVFLAHPAPAG